MSIRIYTGDTIPNKISYWLLASFLITLPFDFFYNEAILVCFSVHTLIHVQSKAWANIFTKSVFLVSAVYLLGLIGIFYSPDHPEAFNVAGRQLAILLIPVLLALNDIDLQKYKMPLLKIFGYTCTLTIIYLYADAFHTMAYFHLPLSSIYSLAFLNHNFSLPIDMHATYLSIYIAFSLCLFLYFMLCGPSKRSGLLYLTCILILTLGMLQLSSRAVGIALMLVINFVFPFMLLRGRKLLIFMTGSVLVSVIILFTIKHIDSLKVRYISDLRKDLADNLLIIESTEPRMARWEAALELVKKSPIVGYGSGSEKELLKNKYFEKKFYNSYLNEFNAHNEYLSILINWGMAGLVLYGYILLQGSYIAFKKRDVLFSGFILIIAIVSVSENVLELNKGIFFYAFFFSLFLGKEKRSQLAPVELLAT